MFDSNNSRKADVGIGLAECIAALLVLAIGALAGMELLLLSVRAGDALQRDAVANSLLAGRLEELLALSFDDPLLSPGGSASEPRTGFHDQVSVDGRSWFICREIILEAAGRKLVSVGLVRTGQGSGRPGARLSGWVIR